MSLRPVLKDDTIVPLEETGKEDVIIPEPLPVEGLVVPLGPLVGRPVIVEFREVGNRAVREDEVPTDPVPVLIPDQAPDCVPFQAGPGGREVVFLPLVGPVEEGTVMEELVGRTVVLEFRERMMVVAPPEMVVITVTEGVKAAVEELV